MGNKQCIKGMGKNYTRQKTNISTCQMGNRIGKEFEQTTGIVKWATGKENSSNAKGKEEKQGKWAKAKGTVVRQKAERKNQGKWAKGTKDNYLRQMAREKKVKGTRKKYMGK